eukprot:gb/GEZN01007178.1/.p1 GENE.gb/GEZN01007178.1/~~gb/GEZN01007178.1/.p1  ORF type:complete len:363 (+),score=63.17 gb/GEZN01007178.1/:139-1227(+)
MSDEGRSAKRRKHSPQKIAVIGSGNWGSVAARLVAQNACILEDFDTEINMWVYPEKVTHKGKEEQLVNVINSEHENVKYLPGIKLGDNVHAVPDLLEAVAGATMLVFVTPHQFIKGICKTLKGKVSKDTKAISLIKGMDVTSEGFQLISALIEQELGIDCAVLMGANVAGEIGQEKFTEATVGFKQEESGELWQKAFNTKYFRVRTVRDVIGCELCGTLKNIVALGAGFVDGLGLGNNTKASIIRIGLVEMMQLAKEIFPTVQTQTFFESAGVADLITTCYGGRNRKCAEAFVKADGKRSWQDIEEELLNGQKLQGVLTSNEVQEVLHKKKIEGKFPLFRTINQIVNGKRPPSDIVNFEDPI